MTDHNYSSLRYLRSKRSVDDRALNRRVLDAFAGFLMEDPVRRPRVLELGAGLGTMVLRLAEWGILQRADYLLIDRDEELLGHGRKELELAFETPCSSSGELHVQGGRDDLTIQFRSDEALGFLARPDNRRRFDMVIANAVLDLMPLGPALEHVFGVLGPGAPFWFSINFDGETIFLPEHDLDQQVLALYHRSMDERVTDGLPSGDSKTGRHLLEAIPRAGASLVAAGSSDWVVFPKQGAYEADEAYFLHHILHTISMALTGHAGLDPSDFGAWLELRHAQVDRAQLAFIAHQLDVAGRAPVS